MRYIIALLALIPLVTSAAQNSAQGFITSIEVRESGLHNVFFSEAVPDEGCTKDDRAIIVDEGAVYKAALLSFAGQVTTVLRVDGCAFLDTGSTETAPRVIKVRVFDTP